MHDDIMLNGKINSSNFRLQIKYYAAPFAGLVQDICEWNSPSLHFLWTLSRSRLVGEKIWYTHNKMFTGRSSVFPLKLSCGC